MHPSLRIKDRLEELVCGVFLAAFEALEPSDGARKILTEFYGSIADTIWSEPQVLDILDGILDELITDLECIPITDGDDDGIDDLKQSANTLRTFTEGSRAMIAND